MLWLLLLILPNLMKKVHISLVDGRLSERKSRFPSRICREILEGPPLRVRTFQKKAGFSVWWSVASGGGWPEAGMVGLLRQPAGRRCGGLRTVALRCRGPCEGCGTGRLARAAEAEKGCGAHPDEHYVARADASHRLCRRRHRFFASLRMTRERSE